MPILLKGAVLYRKLRYRKGHGVHSPFVYNIITKIIEEKTPYYAFDRIKEVIKSCSQRKKTKIPGLNCGTLLFRFVNFFRCKDVLQVGSPDGIMCLFLGSARTECKCTILEENETSCINTKILTENAGLGNINIEYGNYLLNLESLLNQKKNFDLIFINIPECSYCLEILEKCIFLSNQESIFIINGIRRNKIMRNLWKNTIQNTQIPISIDLYSFGIFFTNKNFHKKHYKAYFDHGKEQIIHKNRRQRIHFFSRRKKSS